MAITKLQPFNLDTTANYTFANITATNANLGNAASANFFIGSGANLTSLPAGNISGQVANALVASTVYTNAQPNITSVGTLTGITSTGTADLTGASNVALGPVANVHITGGSNGQYLQTDGSGILSWSTVSSGSTSTISNGNSNVNIPTSNGNVNISSAGNANIVIVTGTGVNIAGTLNTTGNTTVGNLFSSGSGGNISNVNVISANTFIASGNITAGNIVTSGSGGNISNANVISANIVNATLSANLGNSVTANFFIGSGANLTSLPAGNISGQVANALVASTVYTNAQPNITSVGTLTSLAVTGNITAGNANLGNLVTANFFSGNGSLLTGITVSAGNSIVNGNSNVSVIANGNITLSSAGNANIIVVTGTGVNIAGTLNATGNTTVGNLVSSGSGGNISNANVISANTFIASGNITATNINTTGSGGNIGNANVISANTFTASGNITAGNANLGNSVTANYFIGTFYGTANSATTATSATTAGTVTTNAQPNITSTGTLTSITVSGSGSFGANVNLNSFNITNLATPVASTDAATKQYVDDVAQGLNVHDAVAAATPDTLANITTGTITYNNGSSGVGANLTTTGTFNLIDNVNVQTSGTRILVKSEANAVYNGIYTWSNATVITRATDYNTVPEVEAGDFVFCTGGTLYDNTGWVQTSTVAAIGTTGNNIEFTQFSGAGSYYAGTGLTLTGSTFSVNASQTQITSVGTLGNLTVTGNATVGNLTTSGSGGTLSNINVVSANTFTASGNITAGNANLGNAVTANYFIGNLYGTANLATYATTANSVAGGNVTGTVSAATTAGTVTTAAQPNITSVGTLTSLDVTGNVSAGNANLGNLVTANFFSGNGSLLTGITVSAGNSIVNGNSNVSVIANGNVTTSVAGNANILIVTGTGVNVAGTLNVTGNATVGNLITSGSGGNVSNVNVISANTFIASGNITAVNANLGNAVTANYFIGSLYGTANLATFATTANAVAGANVSGQVANALISGTVYTNAQPNITSVGTLSSLTATGNVTGGNLVTAGKVYSSDIINGGTGIYLAAGPSGYINFFTTGGDKASISDTGNIIASNIIANSTVFAVTANISGNVNAGNANLGNSAVANFFTGNGSLLTNVTAVTAGTVTTNAQPNITSVGSLTGLTVSNATGVVDFTTTANVTLGAVANLHITGGTNADVLSTDGSGNLSWVAQSGGGGGGSIISNGNSNVNIPTANGNINFTAVGNTNMVITGTGVNVAGTLNTTGNVTLSGANVSLGAVGNLKITGGTNTYVLSTDGAGNLSWTAALGTSIGVDNFTGNGVQTNFTLATTPANINCTIVSLAGLFQPRTVYSLAGNVITFSSAPANTAPIEITTFTTGNGGGGGGITAQDLLSPFLLMGA